MVRLGAVTQGRALREGVQMMSHGDAGRLDKKALKTAMLDSILVRAAEQLGDLHDAVMNRYYRQFPEALALFEEQSLGHRRRLEDEMIGSVLYCIMTWVERPVEVSIVLSSTVPHHGVALNIPLACFAGFTDAVLAEIAATIPADALAEAALLDDIRESLHRETTDAARPYQLG